MGFNQMASLLMHYSVLWVKVLQHNIEVPVSDPVYLSSAMGHSIPAPFLPRRKRCEVDDSSTKSDSTDDHCEVILNNLLCSSTREMLGVCKSLLERLEWDESSVCMYYVLVNQAPSERILLFWQKLCHPWLWPPDLCYVASPWWQLTDIEYPLRFWQRKALDPILIGCFNFYL